MDTIGQYLGILMLPLLLGALVLWTLTRGGRYVD